MNKYTPYDDHLNGAWFYREDGYLMCMYLTPNHVEYDAPVYDSGYTRKSLRRAMRKAYGKSIRFYSR